MVALASRRLLRLSLFWSCNRSCNSRVPRLCGTSVVVLVDILLLQSSCSIIGCISALQVMGLVAVEGSDVPCDSFSEET